MTMATAQRDFTTGQIATICQVAPRTVGGWIDSGLLEGYRIPGSTFRRVSRDKLIRFLKEHGMPLRGLADDLQRRVLVVGASPLFLGKLRSFLPDNGAYEYLAAASAFDAGMQAESFRPNAVVIDLSIGRREAIGIAQSLCGDERYSKAMIIALANEDEQHPEQLTECGFSETFKRPFDVALLAERIQKQE